MKNAINIKEFHYSVIHEFFEFFWDARQQRYGPIISDISFGTFFEYWHDTGYFKLLRENSLIKRFVYNFGKDAYEVKLVICNLSALIFDYLVNFEMLR